MLKASALALALIKFVEGFSLVPYNDGAGYMTVGWGHLIKKDQKVEKITKEKAEVYFVGDVEDAEAAVRNLVKVPLNQNQFDAMVSFLFNIAPHKFAASNTLKQLNKGDYKAVDRGFPLYVNTISETKDPEGRLVAVKKKLPGLIKRRALEVKLWNGDIDGVREAIRLSDKHY